MRRIEPGSGSVWPNEPQTPKRMYDLYEKVHFDSGRDGIYVHIGWGHLCGIGCSSGWLRIAASGHVNFDTIDDPPTLEECIRAREFLIEKYPSHFNDSSYDGFDVDE